MIRKDLTVAKILGTLVQLETKIDDFAKRMAALRYSAPVQTSRARSHGHSIYELLIGPRLNHSGSLHHLGSTNTRT